MSAVESGSVKPSDMSGEEEKKSDYDMFKVQLAKFLDSPGFDILGFI